MGSGGQAHLLSCRILIAPLNQLANIGSVANAAVAAASLKDDFIRLAHSSLETISLAYSSFLSISLFSSYAHCLISLSFSRG